MLPYTFCFKLKIKTILLKTNIIIRIVVCGIEYVQYLDLDIT